MRESPGFDSEYTRSTGDDSYYTHYSEGSMGLAKRENKSLSLVSYISVGDSASSNEAVGEEARDVREDTFLGATEEDDDEYYRQHKTSNSAAFEQDEAPPSSGRAKGPRKPSFDHSSSTHKARGDTNTAPSMSTSNSGSSHWRRSKPPTLSIITDHDREDDDEPEHPSISVRKVAEDLSEVHPNDPAVPDRGEADAHGMRSRRRDRLARIAKAHRSASPQKKWDFEEPVDERISRSLSPQKKSHSIIYKKDRSGSTQKVVSPSRSEQSDRERSSPKRVISPARSERSDRERSAQKVVSPSRSERSDRSKKSKGKQSDRSSSSRRSRASAFEPTSSQRGERRRSSSRDEKAFFPENVQFPHEPQPYRSPVLEKYSKSNPVLEKYSKSSSKSSTKSSRRSSSSNPSSPRDDPTRDTRVLLEKKHAGIRQSMLRKGQDPMAVDRSDQYDDISPRSYRSPAVVHYWGGNSPDSDKGVVLSPVRSHDSEDTSAITSQYQQSLPCVTEVLQSTQKLSKDANGCASGYMKTGSSFMSGVWQSCTSGIGGYQTESKKSLLQLEMIAEQSISTIFQEHANDSGRKSPDAFRHSRELLAQRTEDELTDEGTMDTVSHPFVRGVEDTITSLGNKVQECVSLKNVYNGKKDDQQSMMDDMRHMFDSISKFAITPHHTYMGTDEVEEHHKVFQYRYGVTRQNPYGQPSTVNEEHHTRAQMFMEVSTDEEETEHARGLTGHSQQQQETDEVLSKLSKEQVHDPVSASIYSSVARGTKNRKSMFMELQRRRKKHSLAKEDEKVPEPHETVDPDTELGPIKPDPSKLRNVYLGLYDKIHDENGLSKEDLEPQKPVVEPEQESDEDDDDDDGQENAVVWAASEDSVFSKQQQQEHAATDAMVSSPRSSSFVSSPRANAMVSSPRASSVSSPRGSSMVSPPSSMVSSPSSMVNSPRASFVAAEEEDTHQRHEDASLDAGGPSMDAKQPSFDATVDGDKSTSTRLFMDANEDYSSGSQDDDSGKVTESSPPATSEASTIPIHNTYYTRDDDESTAYSGPVLLPNATSTTHPDRMDEMVDVFLEEPNATMRASGGSPYSQEDGSEAPSPSPMGLSESLLDHSASSRSMILLAENPFSGSSPLPGIKEEEVVEQEESSRNLESKVHFCELEDEGSREEEEDDRTLANSTIVSGYSGSSHTNELSMDETIDTFGNSFSRSRSSHSSGHSCELSEVPPEIPHPRGPISEYQVLYQISEEDEEAETDTSSEGATEASSEVPFDEGADTSSPARKWSVGSIFKSLIRWTLVLVLANNFGFFQWLLDVHSASEVVPSKDSIRTIHGASFLVVGDDDKATVKPAARASAAIEEDNIDDEEDDDDEEEPVSMPAFFDPVFDEGSDDFGREPTRSDEYRKAWAQELQAALHSDEDEL